MKYVTFDYEESAVPPFWHVYTMDEEPEGVEFGHSSLLTIVAPHTEELYQAIERVCLAIDAAIGLVDK